jgi:hypothetical protein
MGSLKAYLYTENTKGPPLGPYAVDDEMLFMFFYFFYIYPAVLFKNRSGIKHLYTERCKQLSHFTIGIYNHQAVVVYVIYFWRVHIIEVL